jgi:hypothetical protein
MRNLTGRDSEPDQTVDGADLPPALSDDRRTFAAHFPCAGGARVNPNTNGPQRNREYLRDHVRKIADGSETKVTVPAQANLSNIHFVARRIAPLLLEHQNERHRVVDCRNGDRAIENDYRH